jgi:two-component system, OmpR family, response regulator
MLTPIPQFQILMLDDDQELTKLVSDYLVQFDIHCDCLHHANDLEISALNDTYQLLILDLMLPGRDGIKICQDVHARSKIPIVILTARGELSDRVMALEIGADDYLQKPFEPRELVARIRCILRRTSAPLKLSQEELGRIHLGKWILDKTRRELIDPKGLIVSLSNAEFRLLMTFIRRPRQILSREQLIEDARGRGADIFDRSIDLLVSRLRQKLADDAESKLIRTIRGEGYLFDLRKE